MKLQKTSFRAFNYQPGGSAIVELLLIFQVLPDEWSLSCFFSGAVLRGMVVVDELTPAIY